MAGLEIVDRVTLSEADIDGLGHVNQARYHAMLGATRMRLLRMHFPAGARDPLGTYVVARVELDYHREIRLEDGFVDVRAWIIGVGTKSVRIENELIRPDGAVAAHGLTTMVAWDRDARGSRRVGDEERSVYLG